MTNVTSSVNLTPTQFIAGTIPGGVVFNLLDNTQKSIQTQTVVAGPTDTSVTATFLNVPIGTGYEFSVARVDSNGNVLSTPIVSAPFDIVSMTPVSITVPSGVVSVTLQSAQLTVDFGNGFAAGQNLLQTTVSAAFVGSKLSLSPAGASHTGGGVWHKTQQDITQFETDFEFEMPNAQPGSEIAGLTFIIQNSNSTTNPLAFGIHASADANSLNYGAYESLGGNQQSIMNSVAVYFDMGSSQQGCYPVSSGGNYSTVGLAVNGGTDSFCGFVPTNDLNPYGIDFHSGHVFACNLWYDGFVLTMVLKDTVTGAQCRMSWPINIPACTLGKMAWVGFGAANVIQGVGQEINIVNWKFFQGIGQRLSAPTFSVAPGNYPTAQSVTLSAQPGTSIYYTVNGLPPTSSSTLYTGTPISISSTSYLQAVAIKPGCVDSVVSVASYQIGSTNHINLPNGFSAGDGMVVCGNARRVGSTIQMTDLLHNLETGAAWWGVPLKVRGGFSTTFGLQFTSAQGNGLCFVLQNQNQNAAAGYTQVFGSSQLMVTGGPSILGSNQQGMGYGPNRVGTGFIGLYNSVAVAFDLFGVPNSVGLYFNGAKPVGSQIPITGVSLSSGHLITAALNYDGTSLSLVLTDTVTGATFSHSWTADIVGKIGQDSAYAGFTASTEGQGQWANMFVNSWTFG